MSVFELLRDVSETASQLFSAELRVDGDPVVGREHTLIVAMGKQFA